MNLEHSLWDQISSCDIVSSAGDLIATTNAAILPENIVVFDTSIPISVGDEFRRRLPSGKDEAFEVTNPAFLEMRGVQPHYRVKYRRMGQFSNSTDGHYNTVNVNGSNSRVNFGSTDRSTNIVVKGDVFGNLIAALRKDVSGGPKLDRLLASVEEMRADQKNPPRFAAAYQKFMSISADHIGIIAPFLRIEWLFLIIKGPVTDRIVVEDSGLSPATSPRDRGKIKNLEMRTPSGASTRTARFLSNEAKPAKERPVPCPIPSLGRRRKPYRTAAATAPCNKTSSATNRVRNRSRESNATSGSSAAWRLSPGHGSTAPPPQGLSACANVPTSTRSGKLATMPAF